MQQEKKYLLLLINTWMIALWMIALWMIALYG
jgi:hypothetical protein